MDGMLDREKWIVCALAVFVFLAGAFELLRLQLRGEAPPLRTLVRGAIVATVASIALGALIAWFAARTFR